MTGELLDRGRELAEFDRLIGFAGGCSLRACGLVETGETGLELLGDAVKTLERSQSPLELGRVDDTRGISSAAAAISQDLAV